jgi:hypothetical protein
MTPRERILAALNHEIPDHTPTYGWFHHEVQQRLKEYYRTDDWRDVLRNWASRAGPVSPPRSSTATTKSAPNCGRAPSRVGLWSG